MEKQKHRIQPPTVWRVEMATSLHIECSQLLDVTLNGLPIRVDEY